MINNDLEEQKVLQRMSSPREIISDIRQASFVRSMETARFICVTVAIINIPFLLLALSSQIWLRVGLLSLTQAGFLFGIYSCQPCRYNLKTPWVVLMTCWLAVINAVFTNGAGMGHVTLAWFGILIAIAGLIGTFRFCLIWVAIGAGSVFVVFLLEWVGIAVPDLTPNHQRYGLITLHTVAQVVAMAALIISYRRTLGRFEQQVSRMIDETNSEIIQRKKAELVAVQNAKSKDQFLRNLSHEFRTPLNSIVGFSERLLKKYSHDSALHNALMAINRNGKNLHYFVSELLLLDAVEGTPLEINNANLAELVTSVRENHQALAERYEIRLMLRINPACEKRTHHVDIAKLTQAISNLVLFCIRQSPPGAIDIEVDCADALTQVILRDCSPPLPPSARQTLFETHYEYVLANDKDIPASAFSLKIAALIIERHGGRLNCVTSDRADYTNQIVLEL
jgi:signal transduction histidine kinase